MSRLRAESEVAEVIGDTRRFGVPRSVLPKHGAPKRRAHLERVRELRNRTRGAEPRKLDFGYLAFSIPEFDYFTLQHRFPELASRDHIERRNAWLRFQRSELSEPYRVNSGDGKRKPWARVGSFIVPPEKPPEPKKEIIRSV